MQQIEFRAMNCQMLAVLDTDDESAPGALAQVPLWFEEWEQALSRFRDDSELSRLNRSEGQPFLASETLLEVVRAALRAAEVSEGLVSPALLPQMEAAGYDRSFESLKGGRSSAPGKVGDWRAIRVQGDTILVPAGMRLDLGGVAKGWAAQEAARRLAAIGPALVDAGGDIAVSGPLADGDGWLVGIADPFHPDADVERVRLKVGGLATSGRDYRKWLSADGKPQHHILDPRTGRPAETDVLTASVIALNASEAEVAAKVALILGSRDGLRWIESHEDMAALLVLADGRTLPSRKLFEHLEEMVYAWS